MAKRSQRKALGRGLSALISPDSVPIAENKGKVDPHKVLPLAAASPPKDSKSGEGIAQFLPLDSIRNDESQPRQQFDERELAELAESIKAHGVLQPLLVRPRGDSFEIVAGERRWRAARKAGLLNVPAIIKDFDDKLAFQLALVENLQRSQLNPLEEARGYRRLQQEFEMDQQQVADAVGKSRVTVTNSLRLLKLPDQIQSFIERGDLTTGHAKVLLGLREESAMLNLANKIAQEKMSVREVESLVARAKVLDRGKTAPASRRRQSATGGEPPGYCSDVTERLRNVLGTKVKLRFRSNGSGAIEIDFYSESELDRILNLVESGAA